tara:strand:+ start:43740 stop:45575 length:1836 start_codon:yes stop_codon:yes gene_type:complete
MFLGVFISAENSSPNFSIFSSLVLFSFLSIFIFFLTGVYKSVLRFIDISSIFILFRSICIVVVTLCSIFLLFSFFEKNLLSLIFQENEKFINLRSWLMGFLLSTFSVIGVRLTANYFLSDVSSPTKVAIYGAGSAGIQLAGALRVSSEMQPIVFVDSDKSLHDTLIGGLKVLDPRKLRKLASRGKIDEVLIAIPSAPKSVLRGLLNQIEDFSIKVRILPGLAELASGKISVSELKEIEIKDLLGRLEVEGNTPLLEKNIKDKNVLVTGAGGSIGSEISRQIASIGAKKLILLDSSEYALYQIKSELEKYIDKIEIISVIGNVVNNKRISDIFKALDIDTIFHAAAYKHVPLVEENPFEGFFNNVIGTKVCLDAAIANKVQTFVLISTDKAVRPTNVMGATKRLAEMILQSYSTDPEIDLKMTMVRFGNVLGSSGSAVPLFQRQIKNGGPVTVTHPDVIRYFMSIPEAAELVIQAGALGKGGDVFVLDMGEPVKIYELAKRLITLSGLKLKDDFNKDGDIEIIFTGLRPGEKLYEELLIGDNVSKTTHKQIFRAEEGFISKEEIENVIEEIIEASEINDINKYKELLERVILGYEKKDEVVDVLSINDKSLN